MGTLGSAILAAMIVLSRLGMSGKLKGFYTLLSGLLGRQVQAVLGYVLMFLQIFGALELVTIGMLLTTWTH